MKTQSADTHPDAERMLIHLIRNAPINRRFRLIQSLTQGALWSNIQAWRQLHPDASEQEVAVHVVSHWYGPVLAAQVKEALALRENWYIQQPDLLSAMLPILQIFEEQNVFCYLGGSIASSIHGMQQMAQDIDLVIDLYNRDLSLLLSFLKQQYVLDENAFHEAVCQRTVCSLIHLHTLIKIDLVMTKPDALDVLLHQLVAPYLLDEQYHPFQVASATEMILVKLYQYAQDAFSRTDGMRDDAGWNDILGMLKVQGPTLEKGFLEDGARILNSTEIWKQALIDAGIEDEEGVFLCHNNPPHFPNASLQLSRL